MLCHRRAIADCVVCRRTGGWARSSDHIIEVGKRYGIFGVRVLGRTKVDTEAKEPEVHVGMTTEVVRAPEDEVGTKVDGDVDMDEQNVCSAWSADGEISKEDSQLTNITFDAHGQ